MSFGSRGSDIEVQGRDILQMLPRLSAGGLRSVTSTTEGMDTPTVTVTSTPERQSLVSDISKRFKDIGSEFQALRKTVEPGFSRIRRARLNAIQSARRRSQSNLAGNFARRRLGGSSFAADTLTRANLAFGEAEAAEEARTYLEELAATTSLIEAGGKMDIASLETLLNEMNVQRDVALSIIRGAQPGIASAVNTAKGLEASRRSGELSVGEFFSGLAGSALTTGIGNFAGSFGPGLFAPAPPTTTPQTGFTPTYSGPFANVPGFGVA